MSSSYLLVSQTHFAVKLPLRSSKQESLRTSSRTSLVHALGISVFKAAPPVYSTVVATACRYRIWDSLAVIDTYLRQ